jgi:tRNA pseudouridine55 synthase
MTSAVRVGGERLYRKAHRGERAERPTREVEVLRAELVEAAEGTATFLVECSSGTYVRTLIETLGDAYCESLRRIAIGPLELPGEGEAERVEPPLALVSHLAAIELAPGDAERVRHGIRIPAPPDTGEGPLRLVHDDRLVAIARAEDGLLRTEVVLP